MMTRAKRRAKYSAHHPRLDMPSSPAGEDDSVSSPDAKAVLVLYRHAPVALGLSLYALELDLSQSSVDDDAMKEDDDLPRRLPDPILVFKEDDNLPSGMGFFVSGSRLYMIGGSRLVSGRLALSKATYYINLKDIPAAVDADPNSVVRKGPDMKMERHFPLVIAVGGMFYVFTWDLSVSSRVQKFDPGTVSWALLPGDLGLLQGRGQRDILAYMIASYVVHAERIYLCTIAGVFVFDTISGTWTPPEKSRVRGLKYGFMSECVESSQFYVGRSRTPGKLLLYPKTEACEFANPILGDFDLLDPYENHVGNELNDFLVQVSRDRFCFVCDGCDLPPYGHGITRAAEKYIVVHAFDLLQDAASKAVDSLRSPPGYRHQCLSRVLYAMDNDNPWRYGGITKAFIINRKDLGHNAFKRPRLKDCQI